MFGGIKTKTRNKRYKKTEKAIIEALICEKGLPKIGKLAKKAKISRSTLYRHHKTVLRIVPDYEKELLREYTRLLRELRKQNKVKIREIYLKMLLLIWQNKQVLEILFKYEGGMAVEKMVLKMTREIKNFCHLPKNSEKMVKIYAKEVAGIIEGWGKEGFLEEEIEEVLKDIMYLTETMRQRLRPLEN